MEAGERLQFVQDAQLLKNVRVQRDGAIGGVAAGAAAGRFFPVLGVRRGIGAQEKPLVSADHCVPQRLLVLVAFQDRQAIEVWANAADEHVIAVVHQVLRRQCSGQVVAVMAPDKRRRIGGGDVLEHDFQSREGFQRRCQNPLQEYLFPVENVDIRIGHFAVNQQQHAAVGHRLEYRVDVPDIGDAGGRIGGGAGGVELGGNDAGGFRLADDLRGGGLGQVQRHQRLEIRALGGGENPLPVGRGIGCGGHRGHQIGHDDGAAKTPGRRRYDIPEDFAIADMQVPVVGPSQGELICHWEYPEGQKFAEVYQKAARVVFSSGR